ncbi:hypothetical protein ACPUVO_17550 [Pseudocolwellia sp. HL-MZ19]|uniref:hypothetical protein n=1 Tax=unclassified Pseudocolwellia TaxID=2848178 RepID=UPI003CEF2709
MNLPLVIGLLFLSLSTYASAQCSHYLTDEEFRVATRDFKDPLFEELPILNDLTTFDTSENIIKSLTDFSHEMLSFKVDCSNSSDIYFSFYVEDKQVGYMNGVIILQEGKYHSGPYALIHKKPEVLIIKADKK